MLHQIATAALALAGICLMCGILVLCADTHERYTKKQRRQGWREHRAYMDSLEPKRWTT